MRIIDVIGREILDSRGNPTVEVDVILENGICQFLLSVELAFGSTEKPDFFKNSFF